MNQKAWTKRYMAALVGGTIEKTGVTPDGFPFFVVREKTGKRLTIEVSQDEEGNGPGFLFGLPSPVQTAKSGGR